MIKTSSCAKNIFDNAIGHDLLFKGIMESGANETFINNFFCEKLPLNLVNAFTTHIDSAYLKAAFDYANAKNTNDDKQLSLDGEINKVWWKEACFYLTSCRNDKCTMPNPEIVNEAIDAVKELGADAIIIKNIDDILFSVLSPNDENGNSSELNKRMTDDLVAIIKKIHDAGLKVVAGINICACPVNHPWFKEAIHSKDSKYRDYFYFVEGDNNKIPNNWQRDYKNSAWKYYGEENLHALLLMSEDKADINWDNENARADMIKLLSFWLDKGFDGYCFENINMLSKEEGLPDGNVDFGIEMGKIGFEHFFNGPGLHEYLKEIRQKVIKPYKALAMGEVSGIGVKMSRLLTDERREELDMVIDLDSIRSHGRANKKLNRKDVSFTRLSSEKDFSISNNYDLNAYKKNQLKWQQLYGNSSWPCLIVNYINDPGLAYKVDPSGRYEKQIKKLLTVMLLTLKGAPIIAAGEEWGFNDKKNNEINDLYKQMIKLRKSEEALVYGNVEILNENFNRFTYSRLIDGHGFIIECNIHSQHQRSYERAHELVYTSGKAGESMTPYEVRIYRV